MAGTAISLKKLIQQRNKWEKKCTLSLEIYLKCKTIQVLYSN